MKDFIRSYGLGWIILHITCALVLIFWFYVLWVLR